MKLCALCCFRGLVQTSENFRNFQPFWHQTKNTKFKWDQHPYFFYLAISEICWTNFLKFVNEQKKSNSFLQIISIYVSNPRTFNHFILPLTIKSTKTTYYINKTTAVFGNQIHFFFFHLINCQNVSYASFGYCRSFAIESSSELHNHTKALISEHRETIFLETICEILLNWT